MRIVVDVGTTSVVFAPGHRIRISVASSNFPRFQVNPNTAFAEPPARSPVAARNEVLLEASHPSHVLLPVVEGRR